MPQHFFFFDFDSTLCTKESLDELIYYCSKKQGQYTEAIRQRIEKITNQGMNGEISLSEAITQRLSLARIHQNDVAYIAQAMTKQLTLGMAKLIKSLHQLGHQVTILSSGFKELITPSANQLGIPSSRVYANQFHFHHQQVINPHNKAYQPASKGEQISQLTQCKHHTSKTIMIGDGFNDLEAQPMVDFFIGFGANVCRSRIQQESQFFALSVPQLERLIAQLP